MQNTAKPVTMAYPQNGPCPQPSGVSHPFLASPHMPRTNQDALVHVAVVHSQADTDDATVIDLLVVEGQREGGIAGDARD